MAKKNNIILCLSVLLLCACEKQRLLNVPFTDPQYVVNGLFNTGEACRLEISQSQYLNETSSVNNISTATVLLFEDNQLIETLAYYPPLLGENLGSYRSVFTNFLKQREYSINVTFDDNKVVSASDIIPINGAVISNFNGPIVADPNSNEIKLEVDIAQPNGDKQYFHMLLQQRWVEYNITPSDSNLSYKPWFDQAIFPEQHSDGFIPSPSEPFSLIAGGIMQGIMLNSDHFINLTKSIPFTTSKAPQQLTNSYLESRVIVRSVSANYFNYYFSSSQYFRTKRIPLTEPVIIHNNITNGLGNFSGYTSDTSVIVSTFF